MQNSINILPKIRNPEIPSEVGTPRSRASHSSSHMAPIMRQSFSKAQSPLQMFQQPAKMLTLAGTQFLNYITAEVGKFISAKRLNEVIIKELDQIIQMECYLREKKEAILEDRKAEQQQSGIKIVGNAEIDDDQKSCLQQVQDRYQAFRDENEDARSKKSVFGSMAS